MLQGALLKYSLVLCLDLINGGASRNSGIAGLEVAGAYHWLPTPRYDLYLPTA